MEESRMNQQKDLSLIQNFRVAQDFFSREELVKKYLPMVWHILKNYHIPWMDLDDYFQEGAIGLLKAVDQYDPEHYSIKFSTFAYICILRRVFNAFKRSSVKKTALPAKMLSLNSFINPEDESGTLLDVLPDLSFEPFQEVENNWMEQKLEVVLEAYLSPVECQVVRMIFNGYPLKDIQHQLSLPFKVVDNARTRARLKLAKILFHYGSLLNPQIPLKPRKRADLSIGVMNHPA
jgi:RNA polymerase sporulation-specific sigma factor